MGWVSSQTGSFGRIEDKAYSAGGPSRQQVMAQQGQRQGAYDYSGGRGYQTGSMEPCGDWRRGNCRFGERCRFTHEGRAGGQQTQSWNQNADPARDAPRELCGDYKRGVCDRGERCRYSHGDEWDRRSQGATSVGLVPSKGRERSRSPAKPQVQATMGGNPTARFETTEGTFEAEIFLDRVPITASNFIDLAKRRFYDGIHFHRVIPNFMNQFGCPHARDPRSTNAGTGGPDDGQFKNLVTNAMERRFKGGNIQDENISRDSNKTGTLSMANVGRPNTGGSQFFINVNDNPGLDWFSPGASKHPVFGKVVSGMDVCHKISKVPTMADNPVKPIMMRAITITGATPEGGVKNNAVGAPLQGGWEQAHDPKTGRAYYANRMTGAVSWTLPEELKPRMTEPEPAAEPAAQPAAAAPAVPTGPPLPPGWEEAKDPGSGKTYWANRKTGKASWTRPTA